MKTDSFDYALPGALVAQEPAAARDASRLLVVDRKGGTFQEYAFSEIGQHLTPGDCLVLNDTRVIRARLQAHKATGGKIEIFLLHEDAPGVWQALVRPSARVRPGSVVTIAENFGATVEDVLPGGKRQIRFDAPDVLEQLEERGEVPLPPYIRRETARELDRERYQTVYAQHPGAIAAPTAGLHFTEALLQSLGEQGVARCELTLHVGYGTFKPVTADRIEDHQVEPEDFLFPGETADRLNSVRAAGGRVVSVGTTTTRVLETRYWEGAYHGGSGVAKCTIVPSYHFRGVDVLLTNFHLPKSSLLALVCAFGGPELILSAYRYAIEQKFRFYSYGDAMLIL